MATAVPMVPQVPWEWTSAFALVPDPMRGSHLVSGDDGLQEGLPAGAAVFGYGYCAGRHMNGWMPAAQPGAFVHLQAHSGGGVDQRGVRRLHPTRVTHEGGCSARAQSLGKTGKVRVFRQPASGQNRADCVKDDVLGRLYGGILQVFET